MPATTARAHVEGALFVVLESYRAFGAGEVAEVVSAHADTVVLLDRGLDRAARGREELRRWVVRFLSAFSDIELEPLALVSHGHDRVEAALQVRATHSGTLGGMAATGRRVAVVVEDRADVADGRIVRRELSYAADDLVAQLVEGAAHDGVA